MELLLALRFNKERIISLKKSIEYCKYYSWDKKAQTV